jgi:hypothetical protein
MMSSAAAVWAIEMVLFNQAAFNHPHGTAVAGDSF